MSKYDELARLADAADKVKYQSSSQALDTLLEFRDACHPEDIKALLKDRDALFTALRALVSLKDFKDGSGGSPHLIAIYNVGKPIAWADARKALAEIE